jgi:hypothetical protein
MKNLHTFEKIKLNHMSIKKFSEFAMNEDIVPLGFAISSKPSYYTLASSGIRTGYDMQPVVGPVMDLASNLSDQAIEYENNENPDHTAKGYINEALKYVKEKCYECYESKCNESLDESKSYRNDEDKEVNESNLEFIDKNDDEKKITIINKKNYVVLTQFDLSRQNIDFYVNKDQIDDLCKILQKMK